MNKNYNMHVLLIIIQVSSYSLIFLKFRRILLDATIFMSTFAENLFIMACSTDYIDFICSQLEGVGVIRTRKMFGDWMIYIDEKPIIIACDNICYVKKLPEIDGMLSDTGFPYEGAKEHYILDIEHRDEAIKVVKVLLPLIPYPKKRKK